MLNSHAAYQQLYIHRMEDSSHGDTDLPIAISLEKCEAALHGMSRHKEDVQPYTYFVGDLSSYSATGYKSMLVAKTGLIAWNQLLVTLQENQSTSAQLVAAKNAEQALLLVEPPPIGISSEFQRSWEKCREKALIVAGVAACLTFLTTEDAPFPTKIKKNPLMKPSGVCKEIASRMFQRKKTKANVELLGGTIAEYASAVHTADAWAKYGNMTGAETMWLNVHLKAIASQSAQASQASDAKARVKELVDRW
jgi:hypothetical protein